MIAWNLLDTQDINVHNNIYIGGNQGINEEVILNVSGNPQWANIFGKVSKYVDSTNLVQDLNSDINISFDNEIYNNTNISYGVDFFRFNNAGYYNIDFSCLLSNDAAQTLISFMVNGTQIYGSASIFNSGSVSPTAVNYSMSTIYYFNEGDELRIYGEKYNSGPNYLLYNPKYETPCTQLLINKL